MQKPRYAYEKYTNRLHFICIQHSFAFALFAARKLLLQINDNAPDPESWKLHSAGTQVLPNVKYKFVRPIQLRLE